MHLPTAHVCFTALDPGAAVCQQPRRRRPGADSWPRAAGPLRSSRWVSGHWALKSGLARLECPLGPDRAPVPGELARAERLHSSTDRPDSSGTLQTSLRPGSGRRQPAGAQPIPRPGLPYLPVPRLPLTWQFRHQPTAGRRGTGAAPSWSGSRIWIQCRTEPAAPSPVAPRAEISRPLGPGVPETGISGFPEETEERRSRAPYFQWVLAAEGRGRTDFGPGR